MSREFDAARRSFLKIGAALGGGLLLGVRVVDGATAESKPPQAETATFAPNAWVRIGSDDSIIVMIDRSEMGQGVLTSLAMLVAEELEVMFRVRGEILEIRGAVHPSSYQESQEAKRCCKI